MSYGLKNIKLIYQRLVNNAFKLQIGYNMEVYNDDILIKSLKSASNIADL